MTYARQSCTLITEQMMQAHLIVTNSEADHSDDSHTNQPGSTLASKIRREIQNFKEHCIHLANWGQAELFYIFTTCNLIQTNDTTRFYRERVLQIALRILHAEVYLEKYVMNTKEIAPGAGVRSFVDIIRGRIEFK